MQISVVDGRALREDGRANTRNDGDRTLAVPGDLEPSVRLNASQPTT